MLSETRLDNPTQTGGQELIESESRSSDLMEFPSETSRIGTPTSSLILHTSLPRTKKESAAVILLNVQVKRQSWVPLVLQRAGRANG